MPIGIVESGASVQVVAGTMIGPYVVERKLAQGSSSVLFLAHDLEREQPVALKVLRDEAAPAATRARIVRDARALAAVDHTGIVRVHGTGEHEGSLWIAMEYVRGTDLKRVLAERGPVQAIRALRWMLQATDALAATHDVGVIHRDLKPSNFLITHDDQIKIGGFGVAKRKMEPTGSTDALAIESDALGTPAYLSPEQLAHGLADERSDVWALGCILFEMCLGGPPFGRANSPATTTAILHEEPTYPASLPPWPAEVIHACLRKSSFARVASMRELGALVRDALEQAHARSASGHPSDRVSLRDRRSSGGPAASASPPRASEARSSEGTGRFAPPSRTSPTGRPFRTSTPAPAQVLSSQPIPSTERTPSIAANTANTASVPPPARASRGHLKGTAVRTGLRWFQQRYGGDALARIWKQGSPGLRAMLRLDDPSFGIVASGWYETRLVGELLTAFEELVGAEATQAWGSALAEAIAKDNVGGVYRSLFRLITTPAMLEANSLRVWRTYFDEGDFYAKSPSPGELHFEVRHWTHHDERVCRVVGFAIQFGLRKIGYEALVLERVQCVAQGDAWCAFDGMYLKKG